MIPTRQNNWQLPSRLPWGVFLVWLVSSVKLCTSVRADQSAAETVKVVNESVDSSSNVCYNFGCPFIPRDVFYDEDAKTALHRLKEPIRKVHDEDEGKRSTTLFLSQLDTSGDRHRSTMTLCGYKGGQITSQINQDRSILVSPFLGEFQFLGVLDGHGTGGELVAEHARTEIPKQLAAKLEELLQQQNNSNENKNNNLMNLDDPTVIASMLKEVFLSVDQSAPSPKSGGCTASVALQLGSKLFVANAGDSVTLVAAHRGWNETSQIVYMSREDKPHLADEQMRIEQAGGTVRMPESFDDGDTSRVIYKDPASGHDVGLAMSRSIGDWDAPGVIAEPIVDILDLSSLADSVMGGMDEYGCTDKECGPPMVNLFVVSATDGLMDFVTPQEIVDKVGVTFYGQPNLQDRKSGVGAGHAHLAAEELIYSAARGWHEEMQGSYRDDITISTTKIFPWESSS
ncbi:Protein phosphatase 2C [Seminavis robusta]|uniref:Protein phosphatase 2C n=1 Tax=Seminavis robusta TaxID=568900 RepID=A0A9N8EMP9_9STRA|nr:Protein phosphatase 2C [Seminavis robusta]|eukprot:Sro1380_g267760.1 Protein phosphatase 2C (456) ;mRNA; f:6068-7435